MSAPEAQPQPEAGGAHSLHRLVRARLLARIQNYLGNGGFFNPEAMEHDKVRDLIIDCREHLWKMCQPIYFRRATQRDVRIKQPKPALREKPSGKIVAMKKQLLNGYEVETCVELPSTPEGEPDYDQGIYRRFDVPTRPEAVALAKQLAPADKWGAVAITEYMREPYEPSCPALHKVYVSDTEYIEA